MTLSSSESPGEASDTAAITEADRHWILTSERRRTLLEVLEDRSAPVGVEALAAAIGEAELGVEALEPETVERIAITLHHNHLPKLDDAGVVEYDTTSNHVSFFQDRLSD